MFVVPPPISKQAFFWSATVIAETVLGLPLWAWVLVFLMSGYMLYRDYKKQRGWQISLPFFTSDPFFDRLILWGNPGNHAAVTRLIVNGETIDVVNALFDSYINSASHHKAHEIDVVAVHYLKIAQLLKEHERQKWFVDKRDNILARYGYTEKQFTKAMSDAWENYPELDKWD